MNKIQTVDRAEANILIDEINTLSDLARRLTERGTGLSYGLYHQKAKGFSWYTAEARQKNRREWRHVAARWLRRYVGGRWIVAGHHVGRPNFGPAIGERPAGRLDAKLTNIRVDGKPVTIKVIR